MLKQFNQKLEIFLNSDQELHRRLEGFKTFAGQPDGHYRRAREEGNIARAVKCYPFGGPSLLLNGAVVTIEVTDGQGAARCAISLKDDDFSVSEAGGGSPYLNIELSQALFKDAVLGRYRWIWLMSMDEVKISYIDELPHSDWVTILEILVTLQELAEFDPDVWNSIEEL